MLFLFNDNCANEMIQYCAIKYINPILNKNIDKSKVEHLYAFKTNYFRTQLSSDKF